MKANLCLTLFCGAVLMGSLLAGGDAEAQCVMSFNGRVHTTFIEDLVETVGRPDQNLEDVEIRVQGAQRYGTWTTYGEDRTDRIGRFFVSERFNRRSPCNNGRYIRVQVRFENDDLKVRPVQWHTIFDSREGTGRRTYRLASNNLGSIDIDGQGQTSWLAQRHANLWAVYSRVLDYFEDLGPALAFNDQVSVKYPFNNPTAPDFLENSYAYPGSGQVYLFSGPWDDDFEMRTMIHELMHVWMYQHDSGTTGLLPNLVISGSTHNEFEPTHVAFHEGWAEYAMREVRNRLFAEVDNERFRLPHHRNFFDGLRRINDLDDMEHNERGWMTLFYTLTSTNLHRYDFGTAQERPEDVTSTYVNEDAFLRPRFGDPVVCRGVDPWTLSFEDILQAMIANPGEGYPRNITRGEMNFADYLERVRDIHSLDGDQIQVTLDSIDLNGTEQPMDLMDCDYIRSVGFPF